MKYVSVPVFVGLIALHGLCHTRAGLQVSQASSGAHARPESAFSDKPEKLFVEAIKLTDTGDDSAVNRLLDEACRLWIASGDFDRAARARLQVADLYRMNKRFAEALSQQRQTLLIHGISTALRALTYDSVGQIYAELYQTDLAFRNYSKALDWARASKNFDLEAQIQINLADLNYKTGNPGEALKLARSAVLSSRKGEHENSLALSLSLLGQVELKNNLTEQGREDLNQALSLYQQKNNPAGQVKILCMLSGLNLSMKQIALAENQAKSALSLAEDIAHRANTNGQKLGANELRWPCWLALARAQRAAQRREEALKSYYRAVSGTILDWWMSYVSTDRSAIGFSDERQTAYRELIDLWVELGKADEAYDVYQYARMRTLSGLMRTERVAESATGSSKDDKSSELSTSIISLRATLLSPTLNRSQREALERELVEAQDDAAERRLQSDLNQPRRLVFSKPANLKQLRNGILRDRESIVEFELGEDRSFAWLVSNESFALEILPGRKEIDSRVRQYLDELSTAPSNLHLQSAIAKQRSMGEDLFRTLFGRLGGQLHPDAELIIIPDGPLNYLPFETLILSGHYLIEGHSISYLPSASLIGPLRPLHESGPRQSQQLDLLAFGDPVVPQRPRGAVTGNKLVAADSAAVQQLGDSAMTNLPQLPRTRDEVEYIAGLLPKERARLYLGKDSTEGAFKNENLRRYKWIHLATHGLIDEAHPERSAVLLTSGGDPSQDGLLRAAEIMRLDLDCDLVVLSACETGRGQLSSGEGIIGLSRAFLIAGARSIVVSQWRVSDISTAQIMKDFYEQLLKGTGTPAALRAAKLRMLDGRTETRHPYYWAPFVSIAAP